MDVYMCFPIIVAMAFDDCHFRKEKKVRMCREQVNCVNKHYQNVSFLPKVVSHFDLLAVTISILQLFVRSYRYFI
jgi:hypothetical protein